jgi:hypothetical protein
MGLGFEAMDARGCSARLVGVALFLWWAGLSPAVAVFQDGFESGTLSPAWTISTTQDGRATVSTNHGPASGQYHLILDDRVDDALYSVAECTLRLDLANKKNVVLSFKAKSLGNEPHNPGGGTWPAYDGVFVSVDGGRTWWAFGQLAYVGTTWESFSLQLDWIVISRGQPFSSDTRIRFSEYDNASAPLDGIAIDDVVVTAEDDQRAMVEIPTTLLEGSGPYIGYVLLSFAPTNTLSLSLLISPTGAISAPVSVAVPAGQKIASFQFSVLDDGLVNLTRDVTVNAAADGVTSIPSYLIILDDDLPKAKLSLPAQLTEGVGTNDNASITLDRAPDVPVTFYVNGIPSDQIQSWTSVSFQPGQTRAVFTLNAYDDSRIDGDLLVSVQAFASQDSRLGATNQLMVVDNERRDLSMMLPLTLQENWMETGTVSIAGTLLTNLPVSLTSSASALLPVPQKVTIVAGETLATFPIIPVDNALRDGSRSVTIFATADKFAGTNQLVTIRDDEVAGYRFSALSNIVNVSSPLDIAVAAADVEGNAIGGFTGTVSLSVVQPDNATLPLTPSTVNLTGAAGWTGSVAFPKVAASPLRLRASNGNGNSSDSAPFDLMRMVNLTAADLVWDSVRNRFYASVPSGAGGTNANRVVIIDPASAEISGGVSLTQNPGQLALTSGGENLHVALKGNGSIVRIDPASMAVASTFALGSDPTYGTFYAGDICAVAGQPTLLVISRTGPNGYEHYGVAAYDNGVARQTVTQFGSGSRLIEPSSDPTVFFGYDTQNDRGFRRLQLNAAGITEIGVNTTLFNDYSGDIVSEGNMVFSTSGASLDGAQMQRLGTFPVRGPVRPDLAVHRVYFVEGQDSWWGSYDRIGVYDPETFSVIRKSTMSTPATSPNRLIRWGTNGLAFLAGTNVVLINSSQLVPSDPPTDLTVAIGVSPNPAAVSVPLTYTLTVSNEGPNLARNTILTAELSADQAIQSIFTTNGTPTTFNNTISLSAGHLAPGALAALVVTALPLSAGSLACTATAIADPPDPDFADNTATKLVSAGYELTINAVSALRLAANNLLYDPTRNLLWASIPATDPLLNQTVVSINPLTGVISEPIAIGGMPKQRCMALSVNGRYLYVGLGDSPQVHRLDLASGNTAVRIPVSLNPWGNPDYAEDIEVLDGDGTSFLVGTYSGAAVFDGSVRRSNYVTGPILHLERVGTPDFFTGAYFGTLHRLSVTASGVTIMQSVSGLLPSGSEIRGDGNLLLASSGHLINSSNLTLKSYVETNGSPCLDLQHQRAYLVNGDALLGFDTVTALPAGNFALPGAHWGDWAQTCVRWGLDGFAILGHDGKLYVLRWSSTIPASTDSDADGLSDAWEAAYFNSLNVDPAGDEDGDGIRDFLEYLFVTSPVEATESPIQVSASGSGNQRVIRIVFPRRAGLSPQPYRFVFSADLTQWATLENVAQNVLGGQEVGGVQVETIEAIIPATNVAGFVRFEWKPFP